MNWFISLFRFRRKGKKEDKVFVFNFVYALGDGRVLKCLKSDLSLVSTSAVYSGIRTLAVDDDFIYVGGKEGRKLRLAKADLSLVEVYPKLQEENQNKKEDKQ